MKQKELFNNISIVVEGLKENQSVAEYISIYLIVKHFIVLYKR